MMVDFGLAATVHKMYFISQQLIIGQDCFHSPALVFNTLQQVITTDRHGSEGVQVKKSIPCSSSGKYSCSTGPLKAGLYL